MRARYALLSDTGRERERNEDRAQADAERELYAIADGMGGHVAGEVASRIAIEAALGQLATARRIDSETLADAIGAANEAVLREAAARERQPRNCPRG
jgi:protein phosphatase